MYRLPAALLLATISLTAGCQSKVDDLKRNLGPYQYLGIDPQLSFHAAGVEFKAPQIEFGSPSVKYTLNIKQNNQKFPLNRYVVLVTVIITDDRGNKRAKFTATGTVENGALSLSDVQDLYGLKTKDPAELDSLRMGVDSYSWFPDAKLRPFEAAAHPESR